MKHFSRMTVCLCATFFAGVTLLLSGCETDRQAESQRRKAAALQVELAKPEPELRGAIEKQVAATGTDYQVRLVSFYDDGVTPRFAKAVLREQNYENYACAVRYEHFRPDGTLEFARWSFPHIMYGSSSYFKCREETYGSDGKTMLKQNFLFEDGSLSCQIIYDATGAYVCTHYRFEKTSDGGMRASKTVRKVTSSDAGNYKQTMYCKDGSVWWTSGYPSGIYEVNYDLNGEPCKRKFKRTSYSYTVHKDGEPVIACVDRYLREDGSIEYSQTWSAVYDKTDESSKIILSELHFYNPDGKSLKSVFRRPVAYANGQCIYQVLDFKADGSMVERTYRRDRNRASEVVYKDLKTLSTTEFDKNDHYDEKLDDVYFQGVDLDLWGIFGDESHDI